jgi:hypothetical protein
MEIIITILRNPNTIPKRCRFHSIRANATNGKDIPIPIQSKPIDVILPDHEKVRPALKKKIHGINQPFA